MEDKPTSPSTLILLDTSPTPPPFIQDTVLSQQLPNAKDVTVYASRSLSKYERNYRMTRRELIALAKFFKSLSPILLGQQFQICTNTSPYGGLEPLKSQRTGPQGGRRSCGNVTSSVHTVPGPGI